MHGATMDLPEPFLPAEHQVARFADGLMLDCGVRLPALDVAYRTYGRLNAARSNAVLICHALTGDQYVAETHPLTGRPGWWGAVVGPGRPVDTDRFFVICANVLGGCMGSTGPRSPRHGERGGERGGDAPLWGTGFPTVTVRDMVRAQARLLDRLGIDKLFAVVGGSMGGMQALEWAATFPGRVFAAVPIATASFHSAQNIAFHEVGRQAIFADPDWAEGEYWRQGRTPARGLAVAGEKAEGSGAQIAVVIGLLTWVGAFGIVTEPLRMEPAEGRRSVLRLGLVAAAGVVVAAKGLLRWPELRTEDDQIRIHRLTEYFLVGSFVSWLVALGALLLLAR